jgi:hypothetical protein
MSDTQPASPVPNGGGRDPRGRFASGNCLARGNGSAKKVARFRSKLFSSVTLSDFAEIVGVIVREAKAGEKWACELALAYLCGPPRDMDLEERLEKLESLAREVAT